MYTIHEFNFTQENIRYFSNINHLAKDIKKYFIFLSNREKDIFEELNKIKHTQLLQAISKSFGLPYYDKEYNTNINKYKLTVDIEFLNILIKSVSDYILNKTKIKEEFIIEVFDLLFLNITKGKIASLRSSIMKKINLRINHLEEFIKLDIYYDRKLTKKQKLINDSLKNIITKEDYEKIKEIIYNFKSEFSHYYEITKKNYHFVWYPYAFEEYKFYFSFEEVEKLKPILERVNIYKYFLDIKKLLPEWIMAYNINLFNSGSIEETYYIQYNKKRHDDRYVELLLANYQDSLEHHGGRRFGAMIVGPCPFNTLKQEHLKNKYKNKILLKKITWEHSDYFLIKIHTYNDCLDFCCGKDFIGFRNDNSDKIIIKYYEFEQEINNVDCSSHLGNKSYQTKYMKNFFLFKREEDYFEYRLFSNNILTYIVQFKIDCFIVKTLTKKITLEYKEIFEGPNFQLKI